MSEHYFLLKTLHVLGSTVLFGTGLGTALQMWLAHRSGNVAAISVTARNVVIADLFFTTPAVILQPLTGLALALTAGYGLFAPWLVCSYALYLLAGACWIPVVVIQLEMRNLAAGALAQGSALPARYHRLMHIWFALGWPAFIALIVVFWLMVAKPGLWI